MAENLTPFEKRPDSWRLDHADFGTVSKVTYAKGVIKEIKKEEDDPITVKSLAKVEIEGVGESEFIPLFYHPQKQYWDTEDFQAQDFNEGEKYFENAWMSFRGGDEVKVLLKDKKPFAVVGHLDGIPRIGEDIIKFQGPTWAGDQRIVHLQCSNKGRQYLDLNAASNGPDGVGLGLTKEAELLCSGDLYFYDNMYGAGEWAGSLVWEEFIWEYYYEYLVTVGAIAYIIQLFTEKEVNITYLWDYSYVEQYAIYYLVLAGVMNKDTLDRVRQIAAGRNGLCPPESWLLGQDSTMVEGVDYPSPYLDLGFHRQIDFSKQLGLDVWRLISDDYNHYLYTLTSYKNDNIDGTQLKLYSRPHTKEEGLS